MPRAPILIRLMTRMPQATADRFFRISPNRIFGALEAYFKQKNFYRNTLQIDDSLPQGVADLFFRISANRKFGPEKAYSRRKKHNCSQQIIVWGPKGKAPNFVCFLLCFI